MQTHSRILAWRIPMDRGAWWAVVHGFTKSQMRLNSTAKHKSYIHSFAGSSAVKNLPSGDAGSIPESERSPGGSTGNLLQYSCLENPMDRGAWQATVHRVAKESYTTE